MKIGIDASNIRTGGGKKHLEKFVETTIKNFPDITFVIVSNNIVNSSFSKNLSVKCITNKLLNLNNFLSLLSQIFFSYSYFKRNSCDLVFVPGGIFLSSFKPFFAMSQNMLPFDSKELNNFTFFKKLKFLLIKELQINTFNRSSGVIFLTKNAELIINRYLKNNIITDVIPHGIKQQKDFKYRAYSKRFDILYISDFLPYKHNFNVFKAAYDLILQGYNISLTLVGKKDKTQYGKMKKFLESNIKMRDRIIIAGQVKNNEISHYYNNASLLVFASSCENLPFIILEGLSYGLPIITTNKKPMSSLVSGKNVLFDCYDIKDIKNTIINNLDNDKLLKISKSNYLLSKKYIWEDTVNRMIKFFKNNL